MGSQMHHLPVGLQKTELLAAAANEDLVNNPQGPAGNLRAKNKDHINQSKKKNSEHVK